MERRPTFKIAKSLMVLFALMLTATAAVHVGWVAGPLVIIGYALGALHVTMADVEENGFR